MIISRWKTSASWQAALLPQIENSASCSSASLWWHVLGTCAMRLRHQFGVLNSRLNVYSVRGLKIADSSVTPSNVGANAHNMTLIIGEKAAIIIADALGIEGV
ncbi:Alcohol oxidase [Mycena venus]|uniref:Alcohol oxidase n=1 Tax=Mycena venus TaxID=2733690 RepID=A0A8H6YQ54_9AGAR|nr:Alcohol oxidase [Mycena venus]